MSILKSLAKSLPTLLPGYYFTRRNKIQANLNLGEAFKKRTKLKNSIAHVFGILGLLASLVISTTVLMPFLSPLIGGVGTALVFVGCAFILATIGLEMGYRLGKALLRHVDEKNSNDTVQRSALDPSHPMVYSATNPDKYTMRHKYHNNEDQARHTALKQLHDTNKHNKENPEGCFGTLSPAQKEHKQAIKKAVVSLRANSVDLLFSRQDLSEAEKEYVSSIIAGPSCG